MRSRRISAPGVAVAGVFAVAFLARVLVIVTSVGGLHGQYNYDASVYYAAADAMVHGKLPYADFVLVHPPLASLVMTPAALLGRLTTAGTGFAAANLAFLLIGSINAALVVQMCRRIGLALPAATLGGLFYAGSFAAVRSEYFGRLEPLGNLVFLLFVLAAPVGVAPATRRRLAGWGLLGGLACCVKIWWVLPVLLVLGWVVLVRRRPREGVPALGGLVGAVALVVGPFLLAAPGRAWYMIVESQLGRTRIHGGLGRLTQLYTPGAVGRHATEGHRGLLLAAVVVGSVAILAAAVRVAGARVFVAVLVAQLALLVASPSYFSFYDDFVMVPAAVVLAAATGWLVDRPRPHPVRLAAAALPVAVTVVVTVAYLLGAGSSQITPFPGRDRAVTAARRVPCIMSDSPMLLIELDALDRSFAGHCRDWVDVSAGVYGVFARQDHETSHRLFQPSWTRRLDRYLTASGVVILQRSTPFGMAPRVFDEIRRAPALWRSGKYALHRLGPPGTPARPDEPATR